MCDPNVVSRFAPSIFLADLQFRMYDKSKAYYVAGKISLYQRLVLASYVV